MNVPPVIDSIETYFEVQQFIESLLKEGAARKAVGHADRLAADRDQESNVKLLKACTYVLGGEQLASTELVENGAQMLRELSSQNSSKDILYNLASAELRLWNMAVTESDFGTAWLNHYEHLREARSLFDSIANDSTAPVELRLKALTDAGNSYDNVGRYFDALAKYDLALALDPSFAMAMGNRGMALFFLSPLMGPYALETIEEAADCLDAALNDQDGLLKYGGKSAMNTFRELRSMIEVPQNVRENVPDSRTSSDDPYLKWCLMHELFLHVSPDHIRHDTEILDSISFKSFSVATSEEGLKFAKSIIDAFNTLKQEYVSARYLLWLATARDSPIEEHARAFSKRVTFWDTSTYARFSIRTGIAIQSLKAAVDLLDKIAAFVHIFFRAPRVRGQVTFAKFPTVKKGRLYPEFATALKGPERNRGLMALLDLNKELGEQRTSLLKERVIRRNTSTHMFLVAHNSAPENPIAKVDRIDWHQLIKESLDQLKYVRGAILYLANMMELQGSESMSAESPRNQSAHLHFERADPDHMDLE